MVKGNLDICMMVVVGWFNSATYWITDWSHALSVLLVILAILAIINKIIDIKHKNRINKMDITHKTLVIEKETGVTL